MRATGTLTGGGAAAKARRPAGRDACCRSKAVDDRKNEAIGVCASRRFERESSAEGGSVVEGGLENDGPPAAGLASTRPGAQEDGQPADRSGVPDEYAQELAPPLLRASRGS
jgi:hypothetical protein